MEDPNSAETYAKIKSLAELLSSTPRKRAIAFTGAGISASAGINEQEFPEHFETTTAPLPTNQFALEQAIPTQAHMSLAKLADEGYLSYVATCNIDGLHRRSGVQPARLGELYGNVFLETCPKCRAEYLRDYDVAMHRNRAALAELADVHATGRQCTTPGCDGMLRDTLVRNEETLAEPVITRALQEALQAEVVFCLGSNLESSPFCELPVAAKERGAQLIIVGPERTMLDGVADVRLRMSPDRFAEMLMKSLGKAIPKFALRKPIWIGNTHEMVTPEKGFDTENRHKWTVFVRGDNNSPLNFIDRVEFRLAPSFDPALIVLEEPPFELTRVGRGPFEVLITIHLTHNFRRGSLTFRHMLLFQDIGEQKCVQIDLTGV
ncbi:putative transcriptional regulator; Sir2 family protein [Paratrimastix pyriformis]|uniref:Regulatory protein SIR2 homolog 7 n=1 Tax=Paratrimastix pyriformis TaxID=342808 RepID=A0ABQ8UVK0_9EUKA|nr:putative transcriptional regulator; Sir2 family protein [Paratrimastix pyriformis]